MGHPKALIAAALLLVLGSGCASTRWAMQKAFREPGETLRTWPEGVWQEYDCDAQERPFFTIEINELVPPEVRSGGEFNHRLVYALCPARSTEVVAGRLSTRIRFKGDAIVTDTEEGYELKPGRWIVDAIVELPEDAEPGIYAYEVQFEADRVAFDESLTFVVDGP